jgi:hypothetical protein
MSVMVTVNATETIQMVNVMAIVKAIVKAMT